MKMKKVPPRLSDEIVTDFILKNEKLTYRFRKLPTKTLRFDSMAR